MEPYQYTMRDYTGGIVPVDEVRDDLKTRGVSVVQVYKPDDPKMIEYATGMDALAKNLREDGGTANGGRGMGGIVKDYGAACDPNAMAVRMDDKVRALFAAIIDKSPQEVMIGCDAVTIVGNDAARKSRPQARILSQEDSKKAYMALAGGTLQPHVDVGVNSHGSKMEAKMEEVHPVFSRCIQSQFVMYDVPRGGATFVVAPGAYYDHPADNTLFDTSTGRDFCICTDKGYDHFRGKWRAVEAPRGCLILWLSRTPHGNKLADFEVDPRRRGVYISWQARDLVSEEERNVLKRKKMDAVLEGASTDHWSTNMSRTYRGSHYSNGQKKTKVLYDKSNPPKYDDEMLAKMSSAF